MLLISKVRTKKADVMKIAPRCENGRNPANFWFFLVCGRKDRNYKLKLGAKVEE